MVLQELYNLIEDRKINGKDGSYTKYLFDKGTDKILKKIGFYLEGVHIVALMGQPLFSAYFWGFVEEVNDIIFIF